MDTATLRQRLTDILDAEEGPTVDWNAVEGLCVRLSDDLRSDPTAECPHVVYHFLSDADIRQKDADYGREQRLEIRRFAETGECNDSKPISGHSCLFVALAGVAALVIWLLR